MKTTYFDPFQELDRMVSLFNRRGLSSMPVDLYMQDGHYVLAADLPGVDPNSIDISVDDKLLTIRAERSVGDAEGAKWLSRERLSASYLRQFTIGSGVNTDDISAQYDNGVLSILIPVNEKAAPRKISIETASPKAVTLETSASEEKEGTVAA